MTVKLLGLCLALGLLCLSLASGHKCILKSKNCNECIQAGPECAWCTSPYSKVRCHTSEGLQKTGCHKGHIYNPKSSVQVLKNESRTEPVTAKTLFLQPQVLSIHLRPGVSQSYPLTITLNTDQPVTELIMDTSPLPAGVNVTFSSVTSGNSQEIQVNVEADECPSDDSNQAQNGTKPWSIHITPRGFSLSLELHLTLECQCDCMKERVENTPLCSGHGALVCGQCECYEGYSGQDCQGGSFDSCRSSQHAEVCSGRGMCVMGDCMCNSRINPEERYAGRYCECNDFDCPRANGRLCGGHGTCSCGECVCHANWTGDDCGCSLETAFCMATNHQVCNGRGLCLCGMCLCQPPFHGPTCEDCPSCGGFCEEAVDCVECLAFGIGWKKDRCDAECGHLNLTMVDTLDDVPQSVETKGFCKMRSRVDSCFIFYAPTKAPGGLFVVRDRQCPATK